MSAPFILAPNEQHPDVPRVNLGPFIRVASQQTDGLFGLAEARLPPLTAGPRLHVHSNEDEMFFVLEGVLTVQVGEDLHDIGPGGLAWGPRNVPHAFANRSSDPVRIMIMWMPGGVEAAFAELEEYRRSVTGPPDENALASILARYGGANVGPVIPIPGQ